jgi:hypothetical protein
VGKKKKDKSKSRQLSEGSRRKKYGDVGQRGENRLELQTRTKRDNNKEEVQQR